MDKKQARAIIKETFETSFDKNRFIGFIKNLLNSIEDAPFTYKGNYIPDAYEQYINSLERIGKYSDSEHKIDVLVVKLKKETSIERARTMQRNFIAWYLNGSRGGELKDAALAAFISPNEEDWRFSLVKMDYHFEEGKNGRMKIKEEFTPARRWSFLVGTNENSHTAQGQLVDILADDEKSPTIAQLEEAFNIEKVTKEFFEKYRELFLWAKETLDDVVKEDRKIKTDFETKGVNTVDFSKKLLGQIVFLYFLQKKGWFGVKRDADWGTGPKNFLRELFEGKHGTYKNFFNDILEPLFYEALARERDENFYSRFNCKIPFLNGGLFDPINNYDWVHTDILPPNDLFSNTYKTKEGDTGNGILDIFDRYNFTVKEDEPLEKEVAVDPEMLGKVFENLLEVKDRKSKGTYYTPREIVHYMCQQSLINYLTTELESRVGKEDIEALIKYGEQVGENEATVEAKGRETDTYSYKLPESIRQNARLIDEKLASIKVCDPAIGSGAFPVGMMGEVVKTRNVLSAYIKNPNRTIYNFKRECIEKSLYGVDIDAGAVEIAKLRLWLSLVVDEEDIKQIKPLPNLDYKIVCGDSLLGVEKNLFNLSLFSGLERLKPLIFNETSLKKKQEYKKQIDDLISQITNGHKEFDFEVYFSEVFHEKKGFDVVIANPPYVSFGLRGAEKIKKEWDDAMRRNYPNSAEYKLSVYAIFIDKGIQLLKNNGVIVYITPDSFLLGRFFSKLRKYILRNCLINNILMFEKDFWKSGVIGRPVISSFIKTSDEAKKLHNKVAVYLYFDINSFNNNVPISNSYEQSHFENLKYNRFHLYFSTRAEKYVLHLDTNFIPLGNIARITTGVRSKIGQKNITGKTQKNSNWKKGIISGSQVLPYLVNWKGDFINIDKKILWAGGWDINIVENPKLMIRQTGDTLIVGIDNRGLYHLNNVHSLKTIENKISLEYLCAVLNSKLMNKYYKLISLESGRTMAQTDIETLETLPIKIPKNNEQKIIIDLVQKIIDSKNSEEYIEEIEELIQDIYGLPKDLKNYISDNLY